MYFVWKWKCRTGVGGRGDKERFMAPSQNAEPLGMERPLTPLWCCFICAQLVHKPGQQARVTWCKWPNLSHMVHINFRTNKRLLAFLIVWLSVYLMWNTAATHLQNCYTNWMVTCRLRKTHFHDTFLKLLAKLQYRLIQITACHQHSGSAHILALRHYNVFSTCKIHSLI